MPTYEQLLDLPLPSHKHAFAKCQAGHVQRLKDVLCHNDKVVDVKLAGPLPISDIPGIPLSLMMPPYRMAVYNWADYFVTQGSNETVPKFTKDGKTLYCPGQDIISYCIDRQGIWECFETLLVLDILQVFVEDSSIQTPFVLDYGSHIGWYSTIAALRGYNVIAVDASLENLYLLNRSAELNNVKTSVETVYATIDDKAPTLTAAEEIKLLKCDVEGFEPEAFAMSRELFKKKKVEYAIFEISPIFSNRYSALVEAISSYGYDVYQVPDKGFVHTDEYAANPLETIKKYNLIRPEQIVHHVNSLRQENFLFIRHE